MNENSLLPTGLRGLDEILRGGVPLGELYLFQGAAGTGKTVTTMNIVRNAAQRGMRVLCITLGQRVASLRRLIESHNWQHDDIEIWELDAAAPSERLDAQQVAFETGTIELTEVMREILAVVEARDPEVVLLDAISHLRLLAEASFVYRQQLLVLRDFFAERKTTVLLTDNSELVSDDGELQAMVHGLFELRQDPTALGTEQRSLRIRKIRNHAFLEGQHDFAIRTGEVEFYPRLEAYDTSRHVERRPFTSGIDALDTLVGGGLLSGTSCLMVGPAGTGKTSTATLYLEQALDQGLATSVLLFDELPQTYLERSHALGMPLERYVENGQLRIRHVAAGILSLGELGQLLRREVEVHGASIVLLDTLTGFLASMPAHKELVTHLHELLAWLNSHNVLTILVVAQHGIIGPDIHGPVDVSYLADAVLLLRHFEANASINQSIAVYKKRYGAHEKGIRQFLIEEGGIRVGPLLESFSGILTGTPSYTGDARLLLEVHD